jgi:hypothetical protein
MVLFVLDGFFSSFLGQRREEIVISMCQQHCPTVYALGSML